MPEPKRLYNYRLQQIDGDAQERAPDANTQYLVFAILAVAERLEGIEERLQRIAELLPDAGRGP